MGAQQLQFKWDQPSGSKDEAHGEKGKVCQAAEASERTEPVKTVMMEEVVRRENLRKSAVAKPQERKFLGFSFTSASYELRIKLSKESLKDVKYRIKRITWRARRISVSQVIEELNPYLKGWLGYYRLIEAAYVLEELDWWIRRRMRCFVTNQWIKKCSARYKGLRNLGVSEKNALSVAFSRKGPWVISNMKSVKVAMPNSFFAERGLLSLSYHYDSLSKMT